MEKMKECHIVHETTNSIEKNLMLYHIVCKWELKRRFVMFKCHCYCSKNLGLNFAIPVLPERDRFPASLFDNARIVLRKQTRRP